MNELYNRLIEEFKDKEYAHAYVDEFLNTYIATQIKVLREQRNLTQDELASLTDMKQSRISLLENVDYSMWSITTLKKIANAFDLTLKVSFECFSSRINDIVSFSRQSLERLSREDDLSSFDHVSSSTTVTNASTTVVGFSCANIILSNETVVTSFLNYVGSTVVSNKIWAIDEIASNEGTEPFNLDVNLSDKNIYIGGGIHPQGKVKTLNFL